MSKAQWQISHIIIVQDMYNTVRSMQCNSKLQNTDKLYSFSIVPERSPALLRMSDIEILGILSKKCNTSRAQETSQQN